MKKTFSINSVLVKRYAELRKTKMNNDPEWPHVGDKVKWGDNIGTVLSHNGPVVRIKINNVEVGLDAVDLDAVL